MPTPAGSRTGLTRRGAGLAGAAVALVVAGVLLGVVELYALAVADLCLLAGAGAWVGLRRWSLDARRRLEPARVEAGGTLRVELVVVNEAGRRSPTVTLSDPFDGGRTTTVRLAPLPPGGTGRGSYDLVVGERGRFGVGPLEVVLTDPFGLVRTRRLAAGSTPVHAHPRAEALRTLPASLGDDRRADDGALAPASAGDEFFALRPYRVGDDLRRVHWPATARADELVIRQDNSSQRSRLTVAVDLHARVWDHLGLETALSAAASVALAVQRAGCEVRLVCTAGSDSGWLGADRPEPLLDALAGMRPHERPGRPLAELAGGTSDALVLVGSDSSDIRAGTTRASGGPGSLTVVRIAASGARPGPSAPGVLRLAAGAPLAPLWNALASGRTRVGSGG